MSKISELYTRLGTFSVFNGIFMKTIFKKLREYVKENKGDEKIKKYVEQQIKEKEFDVILSHTCPLKYEPIECFLPGIDQSSVDTSTEEWLDKIEEMTDYKAWYCGHWHINKRIDKIHFLFHIFESNL